MEVGGRSGALRSQDKVGAGPAAPGTQGAEAASSPSQPRGLAGRGHTWPGAPGSSSLVGRGPPRGLMPCDRGWRGCRRSEWDLGLVCCLPDWRDLPAVPALADSHVLGSAPSAVDRLTCGRAPHNRRGAAARRWMTPPGSETAALACAGPGPARDRGVCHGQRQQAWTPSGPRKIFAGDGMSESTPYTLLSSLWTVEIWASPASLVPYLWHLPALSQSLGSGRWACPGRQGLSSRDQGRMAPVSHLVLLRLLGGPLSPQGLSWLG